MKEELAVGRVIKQVLRQKMQRHTNARAYACQMPLIQQAGFR